MPLLVLFLILLACAPCFGQIQYESPDQIWEVGDRRWTLEEEHRFGKWIDENMTDDFFIRCNIPSDCADAVYGIRWIYARMNHLPAAATTTDGRLIGHWSTEWKDLPTASEWEGDQRFRAALLYLFQRTWTGTLPSDTYPVRISPDSIIPGTLFLAAQSHAGTIGHVFLDGSQAHPLQAWESALPVKVQKLSLRSFFCGRPEFKARSGLVRFRWPVSNQQEWTYLTAAEHPFYSEEQYSSGFYKGHIDFVQAVAGRIDPKIYSPMEKAIRVMETISRLLTERVSVAEKGFQQCRNRGCPEGSELWEIHNTESRDGMMNSLADHLSEIIDSNHLDKRIIKEKMEARPIHISANRSVTLYHAYQNYLWFSSDPEDSIEARWGLNKCEMIQARMRATTESITFIERTYRKKNPRYAEFSVRKQEQILQRLRQESTISQCQQAPRIPVKRVLSSPPAAIAAARSGASNRCKAIRAEVRATRESIIFIEKTYRKKDPAYADFSIGQQQRILGKLNDEWTTSQCPESP
jgi:hypothetical protein